MSRTMKFLLFLVLFLLIYEVIEWTSLWPRSLTAAVDQISLSTGVSSPIVQNLLVAIGAYCLLQLVLVLSGSLRSLTGERRRQIRLPHSPADGGGSFDD
jgi:hypothetical protein